MSHTLDASPDACAYCHDIAPHIAYPVAEDHAAVQDAAIVRAVRAAAGTENPVKWLLVSEWFNNASYWDSLRYAMENELADALRHEIGVKP